LQPAEPAPALLPPAGGATLQTQYRICGGPLMASSQNARKFLTLRRIRRKASKTTLEFF